LPKTRQFYQKKLHLLRSHHAPTIDDSKVFAQKKGVVFSDLEWRVLGKKGVVFSGTPFMVFVLYYTFLSIKRPKPVGKSLGKTAVFPSRAF
jgi:hypothetical protein